ncbi:MAG: prepilin-type N-terminal cleavage/methylation domain-containing protein [Sulfuricellaceae bacterium]|nr:prepilin-type N-terminal cleavage/methylation domain-containing protein [Sulfuricellaceae bacterium]
MKMCRFKQFGFTLVEMAIVLVIIGLLLGGMLMPLSAQIDQRKISDTQKTLDEIKEALIGFAIANGRLPCPALAATATGSVGAGLEATTGAGSTLACTNVAGVLPWATLGVNELDPWNHRYSYRVTLEFARGATGQSIFTGTGCPPPTNPQNAAFALCSQGNITILSAATGGSTVSSNVPAVVISHGKNGNGAYTSQGTQLATSTDVDELDNQLTTGGTATANTNFVNKTPTATFDDLVSWVSASILFNRMVAAGKLP